MLRNCGRFVEKMKKVTSDQTSVLYCDSDTKVPGIRWNIPFSECENHVEQLSGTTRTIFYDSFLQNSQLSMCHFRKFTAPRSLKKAKSFAGRVFIASR